MSDQSRPNPGQIMQLATAYWGSATLFAATNLDLFRFLADEALSAEDLALQVSANPRAVAMLADSCVGLGLLTKVRADGGGERFLYQNTAAATAYLVPGQPGYLGVALRWSADQYEAWGRLSESVRAGASAVKPSLHLGDDPEQTRNFVLGMHQRALGVARGVIPFLEMEAVTRLLDVGGGPGTCSVLLAQRYPALTSDVLDLPPVVAIAKELVSEAQLSERVRMRGGDATKDDYGHEQYDGVLFSGVLHQMPPDLIQSMFTRAHTALKPGGRVWVSDVMLEPDKTTPVFSTLFSLQMLLTSEAGAVFSAEECVHWLQSSGFVDVNARPLPPPLPYIVVSAVKA